MYYLFSCVKWRVNRAPLSQDKAAPTQQLSLWQNLAYGITENKNGCLTPFSDNSLFFTCCKPLPTLLVMHSSTSRVGQEKHIHHLSTAFFPQFAVAEKSPCFSCIIPPSNRLMLMLEIFLLFLSTITVLTKMHTTEILVIHSFIIYYKHWRPN